MKRYLVSRYGFDYHLTVDDEVMEKSYEQGELVEQGMLDWIVANVPKGGIWVDCGANIGEHSLVYATACGADTVMAFEPVPFNYGLMLKNSMGNYPNLLPLMLGVGIGPMIASIVSTAQGRNSQFALAEAKPNELRAAVVSLDAIVPHDGVRLLKIDVEGAEWDVLRGARTLIKASKPEIFVEIWEQATLDLITNWLALRGYTLIECYGDAPMFFFSASGRYSVTYRPRELQ